VPGMTALGIWSILNGCRISCCESRCSIIDGHRLISSGGIAKRRRVGVTIGAETGTSAGGGGTVGIDLPFPSGHPCRSTNATIRATAIRVWISSRPCGTATIITSRGMKQIAVI